VKHQAVKLSIGQIEALAELQRIASFGQAFKILHHRAEPNCLWVDISVDCSNLKTEGDGLRLRARERLTIGILPRFPMVMPVVWTPHERWAGTPHVQWRRSLCLYRSSAVEWNPSDGMAGYVERLVLWLERAAAGQLDALGEPLHPPVAYTSSEAGLVVVRADAPAHDSNTPWLGFALLRQIHDMRADLVAWRSLDDKPFTADELLAASVHGGAHFDVLIGAAIFLPAGIGFEYPSTAGALLEDLASYGIDADRLMGLLSVVAFINRQLVNAEYSGPAQAGPPLYVVVGTPTRGIAGAPERLTHLAVWRLQPLAERIAVLAANSFADTPDLARIGHEAIAMGREWLASATTTWTQVDEARPEIVISRDSASPAVWLRGKRILVLGAGALGAPICEACVRGGVASLVVADQGTVHSGILVRQPFVDPDIGRPKTDVLIERLRAVGSGTEVTSWSGDVSTMFEDDSPLPDFDLVIDATANRTVRTAIERHRSGHRTSWPALATVLIGHDAQRGIATLSLAGATGAGVDVLRRLGLRLRTLARSEVSDVLGDFYADPPRGDLFQPEPGCSDVTFVGSFSDVVGLAGQMFTGILRAVNEQPIDSDHTMLALIVRSPSAPSAGSITSTTWFTWQNDAVYQVQGDHEVRVNASAFAEMRAEARRSARVRARRVETGGSLLGQIDSASRVVWIDEVSGPPPDSKLSAAYFEHGLEGVTQWISARQTATGRVSSFVGMWHTHPLNEVSPSETDDRGMRRLVTQVHRAPSRAVLLIIGGDDGRWNDWLFNGSSPTWFAQLVDPSGESRSSDASEIALRSREGEWWPGGTTTPRKKRPTQPQSRRSGWLRRLVGSKTRK
jgi:integrative and conjugative element protein (TIGR02256 family)